MTKSTKYMLPRTQQEQRFYDCVVGILNEYRGINARQERVWEIANEAIARVEVLEQQMENLQSEDDAGQTPAPTYEVVPLATPGNVLNAIREYDTYLARGYGKQDAMLRAMESAMCGLRIPGIDEGWA